MQHIFDFGRTNGVFQPYKAVMWRSHFFWVTNWVESQSFRFRDESEPSTIFGSESRVM